MHKTFRNVNDAFNYFVRYFATRQQPIVETNSRNGPVLQIPEPVIITYEQPRERVLFNRARDCNPFFHLFESLWMLAGRNDIAPLQQYNSRIDEFSDDGETLNGAYGYRWRNGWYYGRNWRDKPSADKVDQLKIIIDQLRRKVDSRRVVLQMWNFEHDLLKIDTSRDVCCNTNIYFLLRSCHECSGSGLDHPASAKYRNTDDDTCPVCKGGKRFLDMTVCNRSNDLIWGCLGANVVHMSFLQEYIANAVGVPMGRYHQITNNLHVYVDRTDYKPDEWLKPELGGLHYAESPMEREYVNRSQYVSDISLVKNVQEFDYEVVAFIDDPFQEWKEPWLECVAKPFLQSFKHHKARQYDLAYECLDRTQAEDWANVGLQWLQKREKSWKEKQDVKV